MTKKDGTERRPLGMGRGVFPTGKSIWNITGKATMRSWQVGRQKGADGKGGCHNSSCQLLLCARCGWEVCINSDSRAEARRKQTDKRMGEMEKGGKFSLSGVVLCNARDNLL